jgi:hypothetical protein
MSPAAERDIFKTVVGRGVTEEDALSNAKAEALRQGVKSLLFARSELEDDTLKEKLIEFSRGTVADSDCEVLESSKDESGIILTVRIKVRVTELEENARVLIAGRNREGSGVTLWTTPLLDAGEKALIGFGRELKYENFLNAAVERQEADLRKGLLTVTVSYVFDEERYFSDFALPLTEILSRTLAEPALWDEVQKEYESPDDRFAAVFYLLEKNLSFRGWMLPRRLYDTLRRAARLEKAKGGRVQTNERLWLHFSLLDRDRKEIERLPVSLHLTNMLFFSEGRGESANPWLSMNIAEFAKRVTRKDIPALTAAPRFGSLGKSYSFYERDADTFVFKLSEDLLGRVAGVEVSLELDR